MRWTRQRCALQGYDTRLRLRYITVDECETPLRKPPLSSHRCSTAGRLASTAALGPPTMCLARLSVTALPVCRRHAGGCAVRCVGQRPVGLLCQLVCSLQECAAVGACGSQPEACDWLLWSRGARMISPQCAQSWDGLQGGLPPLSSSLVLCPLAASFRSISRILRVSSTAFHASLFCDPQGKTHSCPGRARCRYAQRSPKVGRSRPSNSRCSSGGRAQFVSPKTVTTRLSSSGIVMLGRTWWMRHVCGSLAVLSNLRWWGQHSAQAE